MSAGSGPLKRSNWVKVVPKEIKECNMDRTPQNSEQKAQSNLNMIMDHQLNVSKTR